MNGLERITTQVSKHGFISLVDVMPRLIPMGATADFAVVQAARVSYGEGTKTVRDDQGLINYLMRNTHTSPFEMVEFKFHVALPIFVARQWIRHRTANVNEVSGRYSELKNNFFEFAQIRTGSKINRQGSDGLIDDETSYWFKDALINTNQSNHQLYQEALRRGVSKEIARAILNLNIFTEWYWKLDLHNLMHFLRLRLDSHAQPEIKEYAVAIKNLIQPIVPLTMHAFEQYKLNAISFSAMELQVLVDLLKTITTVYESSGIGLNILELGHTFAEQALESKDELASFKAKLASLIVTNG